MSFLRGKKSASAAIAPAVTGIQLQTSTNVLPIPILYGANLVAANLIWYGRFFVLPQYQKRAGKGGAKRGLAGYNYYASIILALGEGPIASVNYVKKGSTKLSLAQNGMAFFNGSANQPGWSLLSIGPETPIIQMQVTPGQNLAYMSTAYVAAANYSLGNNADLGSHNFEVAGIAAGSALNGVDADPAVIINDFLTNGQYGAGFNPESIDGTTLFGASGDASLQSYCRAMGLWMSPSLINAEPTSTILTRWLQLINCAAVWSGGRLKFIPYGDTAISGNGYIFTPNVTPVYALSDNDFLSDGHSEPLIVSRVDPLTLPNIQRMEVLNRANDYAPTPVEARDQGQIDLYGARVGAQITAHEICSPDVASVAAQVILQRALYVRASAKFKLSCEYSLLDPMDIVTLSDANLGLVNAPFRIISIEEDDQGVLTFQAEEICQGVSQPAQNPTQSSNGAPLNMAPAVQPVHTPLIFEPPPALTGQSAQIWIGASGGSGNLTDPNWGGANVFVSLDNTAYSQIATITQTLRQGILTQVLAQANGWDNKNTLSVDLSQSGSTLTGTTDAAAQQGSTLILVDHELMAYGVATLTAANNYALTHLQRGLYGTQATNHNSGAAFIRLDDAVVQYSVSSTSIGKTVYFKFQSFNIFGTTSQDLSSCTVYPYSIQGSGSVSSIISSLQLGNPADFGKISGDPLCQNDDWGDVSSQVYCVADLGNAI